MSYKRTMLTDSTYTKAHSEMEEHKENTDMTKPILVKNVGFLSKLECEFLGIVSEESPASHSNTDQNASSNTQATEQATAAQPELNQTNDGISMVNIDHVTTPYLICSSALELVSVHRMPQMQMEPEHISPNVSQQQAVSLSSNTEVAPTTCNVNKTKKAKSGGQTGTKRKMETLRDANEMEYAQPLKVCKVTVKAKKQVVVSKSKKQAVVSKSKKQAVVSKAKKPAVVSKAKKPAVVSKPVKATTGMKTVAKRKIAAVNDEQETGNVQPSKVRKVNDKSKKQVVVNNPKVQVQKQCNIKKVVKNTQIAIKQKPAKKAVSTNSKETQQIESVDTQMLVYTTENQDNMVELDWYDMQAVYGLMRLMKDHE